MRFWGCVGGPDGFRYFGGPAGIGHPHIIGFYVDDDWGNMNPNGPSEMEGHAMEDMGMNATDLADMVQAYVAAARLSPGRWTGGCAGARVFGPRLHAVGRERALWIDGARDGANRSH